MYYYEPWGAFVNYVERGLQEEIKQRGRGKQRGRMDRHSIALVLGGFLGCDFSLLEAELRPFPGFCEIPLCSSLLS